jgi:hypothetical protein
MQKPTRARLFLLSLIAASTLSTGIAAILQTASQQEFTSLRQATAQNLSGAANQLAGFFPFWFAVFAIVLTLSFFSYLLFFYSAVRRSGAILSRDGVLLFDREQHIAISVPTLKSILTTLGNEAAKGRANELLYRAGELAGRRFGGAFRDIYIGQIEPHGARAWSTLSDNDKLNAWERYDATVGWGQISAHKFDTASKVEVMFRHPTLYAGPGGELFSWLLAGYAKEVATALIGRSAHFDPTKGFVRDDGVLRLTYSY